jgi:hypothetical protein
VTEIYHVELPAHALQIMQVRFMLVSNEGHFTLEAKTVFRPYVFSHWSWVTDICHMALPAHA